MATPFFVCVHLLAMQMKSLRTAAQEYEQISVKRE
jgi:hypothetical protein